MTNSVKTFLEKHHFFSYQKNHDYLDKLSHQISVKLNLTNPLNIRFSQQSAPLQPNKTPKTFLLMDLGGTHLRLYLCQTQNNQVTILKEEKSEFYKNIIYTPDSFLGELYKALNLFLQTHQLTIPAQIILSFANKLQPNLQQDRLEGQILYFGKNHQQEGLIGLNLASSLENFLHQQHLETKVKVINDGSLTALSGKFQSPTSTIISLIAGTGTNINIAYTHQQNLYLVNLEFGDFDFFPYSVFDQELNTQTPTANHYLTEKLFAGAWQNQLFTIILKSAFQEKLIKQETTINKLRGLSSKDLEQLFGNTQITENPTPLLEIIGETSNTDLEICRAIWSELTHRGAEICALAITLISSKLIELGYLTNELLILESGAIFEHSTDFRQKFKTLLKQNFASQTNLSKLSFDNSLYSNKSLCTGAATLLSLLP